ncbi:integrase core domain-containing protein [Actinoplanes philippinensis]
MRQVLRVRTKYNHHRPHSAIGGLPPITRLTNVPGQHT